MHSVVASMLAALITSALLTPLIRRLALKIGAVDEPAARRVHARRIPRLGGVALVGGFFLPLVALFLMDTQMARLLFQRPNLVLGMAAGGCVVAILGIVDDVRGVSARTKLGVQFAAALTAYFSGFQIEAIYLPGIGTVGLGELALPLTLLWIVGVVNALNLIDGLDGLAAGVAFFACVSNFVVSSWNGDVLICLLSATLAGALLGFLFYNFNPASIFMGDSGSMFLGFILATMSLFGAGGHKGGTAIALIVPVLALGLPIMDMSVAMVRRFIARRSIFAADRGHIHHRLLDAGLTHRRAVFILYGLCVVFTAVALAVHVGRSWQIGASLTALTMTVVGISRFVGVFSKALREQGGLQAHTSDVAKLRMAVPKALSRLEGCADVVELQTSLKAFCEEASLLSMRISTSDSEDEGWEWSAVPSRSSLRDAVTVDLAIAPRAEARSVIQFRWDAESGEVSPQATILLQLVVDSVEEVLTRTMCAREARAPLCPADAS